MIVVDLETSGGDFQKCGIIQIGAIDLENPKNVFLEDARLNEEYEIVNATNLPNPRPVLEVIGMTEEEIRDKNRQSEKQLLMNFFEWCKGVRVKNFVCQNIQFDYGFIWFKALRYGLDLPFGHRGFDIPSVAEIRYLQVNGELLMKNDLLGMGLSSILEFVGMRDNRKAHNALEDAKLEAECFYRLVYGKSLFSEYLEFDIPSYLKKEDKGVLGNN